MKTLYLSIMILSCFVLLSVMLSQNVSATVPLVEIMLSGTANNQNCENKCVIFQTITIQKGSTVEWINNDLIPHILVSGNLEDKNNGTLFDSGQIWVGKFFMHNFNDVGVYHYFEKDHPENTGIINVTDGTYPQSISEVVTGLNTTSGVESPLKQFKSGIAANDIKCGNGLSLVIKAEDGSPACVKAQTVQKLVERGWGWAMQKMDSLKPWLANRIIGLENDTGIVTFGNQTYYFETPHYTDAAFSNPVQISFHDVLFTLFPSGFKGGLPINFGGVATNGCGGSYFWTDAKFPDGTHKLLNFFAITNMSQHCQVLPAPTDFSNHTNPQAGLTFYDGKMKLLVSTDNQTIEKKFSVIPSQVAKQSKTVNATTLQCENEFQPKETQHVTFPNGTSLTTNYVPVFLMKPNSTGKICITNNIASQSTDQSSISVKTTSGVSKDDSETSDVIVVPYPENIVVDNTTKTIVYTITTSNVANGFYRISTTFDFCSSGIPLAVGYNSSHLFDNDFPWLGQTIPCPFNSFQSVQTQITGLTGIDIAYITKEYR